MFDKIKKYEITPYINEDTVCVIDIDGIIFKVSAISESRQIKVINKSTNESHFLKTRTEFFGRSKNKIGSGSWLANRNIEKELLKEEPYTKDDWEIEDVASPQVSFETAKDYVLKYINSVFEFSKCNKKILLVGGDNNFRDAIKLPRKYKANRDNMIKPIYLDRLREWGKTLSDVVISEGIEADDLLGIYGFKGYKDYLKSGKFSYIVSTNDKDAKHTPSLLFDWTKEEGDFVHPYFYLIPDSSRDVGELFLTKNNIKFYGLKGLAYQLLVGDDSDGYSYYKHFDLPRGVYGNVTFYKDFAQLKTPEEVLNKLKDKCKDILPNGIEFTAWDGTEMKMNWFEWLEVMFQCAYMKRFTNDKTTIKTLFDYYGVNID